MVFNNHGDSFALTVKELRPADCVSLLGSVDLEVKLLVTDVLLFDTGRIC